MDPMYFMDEDDDLRQMLEMRQRSHPLEQEHLETRVALRDAEAALNTYPDDEQLKTRVKQLQQKLDEINRKAPWISAEHPVELWLFGAPHG
ncbi:MAG: hypothetical protein ACE14L_14420 [Terriglobales bacterium]